MKVTLKSGKEVEYKDLTFYHKAEVWDLAFKNYQDNLSISLYTFGKAVQYATGISEEELNKWDVKDIFEFGSIVVERLQLSETDKKK